MINYYLGFTIVFSLIGVFFEHQQHKEYAAKHPDYEKCPSGVLGFVIISIVCVIGLINSLI